MDFKSAITELQKQGLYRELQEVGSPQSAAISIQGRSLLNFSSNNYLGLAADPRLTAAAAEAAERYGWGAGSAALITGQMSPHEQLREALRDFFQTEAALLFNSGYHANVGAIPALLNASGIIFSDALNHASIIDGCRLAKCPTQVYRHGDAKHLEELLQQNTNSGPRWIITESVFSMDGDLAPLQELAALAHRYECGLYIDEAHAVGVFGENGRGLWETVGAGLPRPGAETAPLQVVRIGTLGKAFGSYGAFALGTVDTIDYLLNCSRTFIYTTGLPPAVAAVSQRAIEIAVAEPERREKLWQHVRTFSDALDIQAKSPIIPWIIPGNDAVLAADRKLLEQGCYVHAIRSPTVAAGKERLRITLSAMHTEEQVEQLIKALR